MVSYCSMGSSISVRSILQPCGTKTPNPTGIVYILHFLREGAGRVPSHIKHLRVLTLSLLVAPQQIESGTARLDPWEDRALLRHRLKCSSLAVQLKDLGYRV